MAFRCVALLHAAASTLVFASTDVERRQLRSSVSKAAAQQEQIGEAAQQNAADQEEFAVSLETAAEQSLRRLDGDEAANETEEDETEIPVMASVAGRCNKKDEASMARYGGGHGSGSFPKRLYDCGSNAYSWFSFHKRDMQKCVQRLGLTSSCASCFADAGEWSLQNCKAACLFGSWCSHSCESCVRRFDAQGCIGADIVMPAATTC